MNCDSDESVKEQNLRFKRWRVGEAGPATPDDTAEHHKKELRQAKEVKAVTVCFSDIEGRFHMLDYDKDFVLNSDDNLTFDGSSIRGFTHQNESDLRLTLDWDAFYIAPPEVFGPGKVMVFGEVRDRNGKPYDCDLRAQLKAFLAEDPRLMHVAAEIEGFLFRGKNAEKHFHEDPFFRCVTTGGYFNTLPSSDLRNFIDQVADAQRALGFENEKDHPEVAPSQFELNWRYTDALIAADQIQLYKMVCRVVADRLGMTASFLPKPLAGVNGSGMHTNISFHEVTYKPEGKIVTNLMHDADDKDGISTWARKFADGIIRRAKGMCLILNPSVNAYRRLDPEYEAPNEIFASAVDRGAMIRFPLCNEKSARVEVRSVSPDANPYLLLLILAKAGLQGQREEVLHGDRPCEVLPHNIHEALHEFNNSDFIAEALAFGARTKYADWKEASADRCPKLLGKHIKPAEVMFHHEVTNQYLWQRF